MTTHGRDPGLHPYNEGQQASELAPVAQHDAHDIEAQHPQHDHKPQEDDTVLGQKFTPPIGPDGKRDYSKSPAQLANPGKVFDSDCTIAYRDVSIKVRVPKEQRVKNVLTPVVDAFNAIRTLGKSCERKDFYRIKDVSGMFFLFLLFYFTVILLFISHFTCCLILSHLFFTHLAPIPSRLYSSHHIILSTFFICLFVHHQIITPPLHTQTHTIK